MPKLSLSRTVRTVGIWVTAIIGALVLVNYASLWKYEKHDENIITAELRNWLDAGEPKGSDLVDFMHGRRDGLFVTNCSFNIQGRLYVSQFAWTNAFAHPGALFITKGGDLIWTKPSGVVKLLKQGKKAVGKNQS
jgi:hypothetical protein